MVRLRAVLDLSTTTVTIVRFDGHVEGAIGPGVTRTTAPVALADHGFRLTGEWELTSPPDGFQASIEIAMFTHEQWQAAKALTPVELDSKTHGELERLHYRHLEGCEDCNLDKECCCAWAPEPVSRHACNCPGDDDGPPGWGYRVSKLAEAKRLAATGSPYRTGGVIGG